MSPEGGWLFEHLLNVTRKALDRHNETPIFDRLADDTARIDAVVADFADELDAYLDEAVAELMDEEGDQ